MYAIDRNVAVIKPKQAFMEWLNALPDNDVQLGLDSLRVDCTVLLIPEFEEPEQAIAYIDDDELVEVTPKSIRLRKRYLDPHERKKASRAKLAA